MGWFRDILIMLLIPFGIAGTFGVIFLFGTFGQGIYPTSYSMTILAIGIGLNSLGLLYFFGKEIKAEKRKRGK